MNDSNRRNSWTSLRACDFLLEQDVKALTEKEFYVTEEWTAQWKRVSYIQTLPRGWVDLSRLEAVDQHE